MASSGSASIRSQAVQPLAAACSSASRDRLVFPAAALARASAYHPPEFLRPREHRFFSGPRGVAVAFLRHQFPGGFHGAHGHSTDDPPRHPARRRVLFARGVLLRQPDHRAALVFISGLYPLHPAVVLRGLLFGLLGRRCRPGRHGSQEEAKRRRRREALHRHAAARRGVKAVEDGPRLIGRVVRRREHPVALPLVMGHLQLPDVRHRRSILRGQPVRAEEDQCRPPHPPRHGFSVPDRAANPSRDR